MANKKVEEKNMKNKKNDIKKVPAKKKEKIVEAVVEEEMITCEECGKKYLASLNECPKCGNKNIEIHEDVMSIPCPSCGNKVMYLECIGNCF